MKDIFESMEDAVEKRYDEMYVDSEHYRCSCGAITDDNEMNYISENPYCEPVCNKCFEEWFEKEGDQ